MKNEIPVVTEAVPRRSSVKEGFLKISQSSQENTCVAVFFLIKFNFIRKDFNTGVLL